MTGASDRALNLLVMVGGGFSAALGLLVLLGWYTHNVSLVQVLPAFVPMQYNTALGFLIGGLGLLVVSSRPGLAGTCGAAIGALGLLTLIQYILVIDLGIDQALMEHYITVETSHPGRMAPNTALCFLLTGAALLVMSRLGWMKRHAVILALLSSAIVALGVVAFMGYLGGIQEAYGWGRLTRMAVHTAAGCMVLGTGIFAVGWREDTGISATLRQWLAVPVAIGSVTCSLLVWQALLAQERAQIERNIESEVSNLGIQIKQSIETDIRALIRMARRQEFGGMSREEWEADAVTYLSHQPGLYAIGRVDPSFQVGWIAPLEGNEETIGADLAFSEERRLLLEGALDRREVLFIGPIQTMVHAHKGFLIVVPIFIDDHFEGCILGVFHLPELLEPFFTGKARPGLSAAVFDGEEEIYSHYGDDREHEERWGREATVEFYQASWQVRLRPGPELLATEQSSLPQISLLVGLFMASLLAVAVQLGQTASVHAKALKRSQEEYQDLYDNAPDMFLSVDNVSKKIIACNQTLIDTTGYAREEIIGHRTLDSLYTSDSIEAAKEVVQRFRSTGEVRHAELRIRCKDGSIVEISSNISAIRGEQGNIRFSRNVWRDITKLKRAREDVRKLNEELEERVIQRTEQLEAANRELEGFSYSVSHDLRAPLRHMGGFLDLLGKHAGPSLDEKSARYLGIVRESAQKMGQLIDDLLDFSRIARVETKKSQVNMNQLVKEVQGQIEDRDIVWKVAALPKVWADPSMMRLVIQNLVDNAVKYTRTREKVGIEIGHSRNGEEMVFFIRDNGVGFDMQYVDKLFGVFQRLHRKEEFEGTGIGLANVKRIIHRHGGRVWAKGKVNEGATFYFSLPKEEKNGSNEANSAG